MTKDKINSNIKDLEKGIAGQFIKFCLVGVLNTLVDFGVYLFFSRIVGLYFLYANFLAVFVAMTSSFILNKYWTFGNQERKIKSQYIKFALVNLVYFFLNSSIIYILVSQLKVYDLLAKIIAIGIGLIWNFFANRYWTFSTTSPCLR